MIKTEQVTIGNYTYTRTYSDANRYVVRDGAEYEEALDSIDSGLVYTEGNLIPTEDVEDAMAILDILLGGAS
jgi:hypothetical protein